MKYEYNKLYCENNEIALPQIPSESIDLIVTDPPYAINFMGKDWDKALPPVTTLAQCNRILKSGAFAFFMCTPRQDCLSHMLLNLEKSGFNINFTSIFWAYASGFPKSMNISKTIDKQLGCEREVIGIKPGHEEFANRTTKGHIDFKDGTEGFDRPWMHDDAAREKYHQLTVASSPQAKALDGSYAGFQPKPSVEIIIVTMKPLSEKTYVEQALKNNKGVTWLDNARIPTNEGISNHARNHESSISKGIYGDSKAQETHQTIGQQTGRFPANLLVSDDILNDDKISTSDGGKTLRSTFRNSTMLADMPFQMQGYGDSGSFSRYFDLDKWFDERLKNLPSSVLKTFPFLIVEKSSKSERNKGCDNIEPVYNDESRHDKAAVGCNNPRNRSGTAKNNFHPTVKPLKLMQYLCILGSMPGDIILDPWLGSGSTAIAAALENRKFIGFDVVPDYIEIANSRLKSIGNLEILTSTKPTNIDWSIFS